MWDGKRSRLKYVRRKCKTSTYELKWWNFNEFDIWCTSFYSFNDNLWDDDIKFRNCFISWIKFFSFLFFLSSSTESVATLFESFNRFVYELIEYLREISTFLNCRLNYLLSTLDQHSSVITNEVKFIRWWGVYINSFLSTD